MGLFAKRPPCPICGGKVKGLLTWKVGGEKVCDDCYGFVDLPDKMVDNMSIEEFKQYMVFRDENDVLRQEFQETQRIDFGWLDTKFLFDMPHRYLCMDKHLKKTIFEGGQIKSFVIREDSMPLYEGSANGLRKHESGVPAQVAAMAPQIQQIVSQKQFQRNMERLVDKMDDGKMNHSTGYYDGFVDIAAPFKNFILEIRFDHPYWKTFTADTPGPTFDSTEPNAGDYLNAYREKVQTLDQLATALMAIAFPSAKVEQVAAAGVPGQPAVTRTAAAAPATSEDAIEAIQKFKRLYEEGVITEEEFAAKKRQLLGI